MWPPFGVWLLCKAFLNSQSLSSFNPAASLFLLLISHHRRWKKSQLSCLKRKKKTNTPQSSGSDAQTLTVQFCTYLAAGGLTHFKIQFHPCFIHPWCFERSVWIFSASCEGFLASGIKEEREYLIRSSENTSNFLTPKQYGGKREREHPAARTGGSTDSCNNPSVLILQAFVCSLGGCLWPACGQTDLQTVH